MTTRTPAKIENPIVVSITVAGTAYNFLADPNVARIQINDRPQAFRTSQAEAFQGQYRDALSIGGITNALGDKVIGPWSRASISDHLAHGHLHILYDAECDTLGGERTLPRKKNSPAFGAGTGDLDIAGQGAGAIEYNPQPAVYFEGTSASGVYVWDKDDSGFAVQRWGGSSWARVGLPSDVINTDVTAVRAMAVHKGYLFVLGQTSANDSGLWRTAAGDFSENENDVVTPGGNFSTKASGSRLLDDGNTLWAFCQNTTTTGAFNIYKSTNADAAEASVSWTTVLTSFTGQLRDVGFFFDRAKNPVIVVLTTRALYFLDETNNKLELLKVLPAAGRAMTNLGEYLMIALDNGRFLQYFYDGSEPEYGPTPWGGKPPSGKDFGPDAGGVVCVADSLGGPIFGISGDTVTSNDALIIIQWRVLDKGWRWIGKATVDAGHAMRFLYVDPVSGDLLGAHVTSANNDSSTSLQYKQIETPASQMGTKDFETSGFAETSLITLGPSEIISVFYDLFYNCENLDDSPVVTLQTQFGVNGAVATTSTLDTSPTAVDRAKRYFPADATLATTAAGTEGVGTSFNTVRVRELMVGTATVGPLVYNTVIGYAKIPDAKDLIIIDAIVDPLATDMTIPASETVWTNVATVKNSKLKVTLNYSKVVGDILAMPIPETRMQQLIPATEILPARRSGTVRFVFAQV